VSKKRFKKVYKLYRGQLPSRLDSVLYSGADRVVIERIEETEGTFERRRKRKVRYWRLSAEFEADEEAS
jgi:hypothetical protein